MARLHIITQNTHATAPAQIEAKPTPVIGDYRIQATTCGEIVFIDLSSAEALNLSIALETLVQRDGGAA